MEIAVSKENARVPVTLLALKGRLDASSYEQLRVAAEKEIMGGAQHLLLDFSGLEYMSSAGIRSINQIFDMLHSRTKSSMENIEKGIRDGTFKSPNLKLVNPRPHVLQVLKMVGIDMFLDIHKDLKSALASF